METIDRNRFALLGLGLVILTIGLAMYLTRLPPQIGLDEGVFKTVDSLFTAVNSRDQSRLTDCEQRLLKYRQLGTLPAAAANDLESMIQQARSGQWEESARRLYAFMLGQRRSKR